jgi:hypothetical protein
MQAPEKRATPHAEEGFETATGETFEPAARGVAPEEWRHSFWDSLVSFWSSGEPEQRLETETLTPEEQRFEMQQGWLIDEWDFSAEHGYEPEFEGRSEFEHGEFDRWL